MTFFVDGGIPPYGGFSPSSIQGQSQSDRNQQRSTENEPGCGGTRCTTRQPTAATIVLPALPQATLITITAITSIPVPCGLGRCGAGGEVARSLALAAGRDGGAARATRRVLWTTQGRLAGQYHIYHMVLHQPCARSACATGQPASAVDKAEGDLPYIYESSYHRSGRPHSNPATRRVRV